jgi:hypothetical protein
MSNGGSLVTVRGAELVEGRIIWGDQQQRCGELGVWSRVWRFVGPTPMRLLEGERFVLAVPSQHWCVPLKRSVGMTVMWPAVFVANMLMGLVPFTVWPVQVLMWGWAVVHSMMVCHRWISWRLDVIVVTDRRLLQLQGVFTNTMKEVVLDRVTNFEMHQSFWGQWFRFGWLRIEAAGVHDDGAKREFIRFVPDVAAVFDAAHAWMTRE